MARPDGKLLRRDGTVALDPFVEVSDDAPLPAAGAVLVSHARFEAERAALLARSAPLGVVFPAGVDAGLDPDLARLALVAYHFSRFADGRPYSHARNLRQRWGFAGELRACGDVLRDQVGYLARCGFDAFEIRADRDPEDARHGLLDFSVDYQPWLPRPVVTGSTSEGPA